MSTYITNWEAQLKWDVIVRLLVECKVLLPSVIMVQERHLGLLHLKQHAFPVGVVSCWICGNLLGAKLFLMVFGSSKCYF